MKRSKRFVQLSADFGTMHSPACESSEHSLTLCVEIFFSDGKARDLMGWRALASHRELLHLHGRFREKKFARVECRLELPAADIVFVV